jgi:hypothetical protein
MQEMEIKLLHEIQNTKQSTIWLRTLQNNVKWNLKIYIQNTLHVTYKTVYILSFTTATTEEKSDLSGMICCIIPGGTKCTLLTPWLYSPCRALASQTECTTWVN